MAELIDTGYTYAKVSCDEGQPVWLAEFTLASRDSYARTQIGDLIQLEVRGEVYCLRVDSRTVHRSLDGNGALVEDYTISAMSPLGFLDAPWAVPEALIHYAAAVDAKAAVEAILKESVHWNLPTWTIYAGALSMAGVTPLQAAKAIVESAGGVIESFPNGEINCRLRDPVNVPDYGTALVEQYFTDHDITAISAVDAPMRGFNRVTVSNAAAPQFGSADRLELVPDPLYLDQFLIRAYLAEQRPVSLVHTGSPRTVIKNLGLVTRIESEVIEFIEGKASLKYPGQAFTQFVWQHTNLGAVTVSGSSVLAAVVNGYSLAAVSYTVQSLNWEVSLPLPEDVQFLLV